MGLEMKGWGFLRVFFICLTRFMADEDVKRRTSRLDVER